MDRKLALEVARITEAAALSAAKWIGKGKKDDADEAATSAMRSVFDTVDLDGVVVIGEGEMDEAPMLYIGERLGTGNGPKVDIAVDPLEGTNIVASGAPNSLTVLAIADRGTLLHAPDMYMHKIAVGPEAAGHIDINASVYDNLKAVAKAKNKDIEDVVATVLLRERHAKLIQEIRDAGARVKLITDGDVAAAINTAFEETGVDILFGQGGAPEGVLAAVALKCLGGEFQGKLAPQNDAEVERCREMGITDINRVFRTDDLVKGDDAIFAATGVTDGELVKGVRFLGHYAETETLLMRAKTNTIRKIQARHNLAKKPDFFLKQ